MKKDGDAAWYAREMLNVLIMMALFNIGYWLPMFGERLGIEDVDSARRAFGVLLGVYLIVDGNRTPKMTLVPMSHFAAAETQRLLRVTGWTSVVIGAGYALVWLALPVDLATAISGFLLFLGLVLFSVQMFLSFRRARDLKREVS
jgi:hypothetical protein